MAMAMTTTVGGGQEIDDDVNFFFERQSRLESLLTLALSQRERIGDLF